MKAHPALSAEDYLRQSILEPNAYVVSGIRRADDPKLWRYFDGRTDNDLIAFLMTLEEPGTEAAYPNPK